MLEGAKSMGAGAATIASAGAAVGIGKVCLFFLTFYVLLRFILPLDLEVKVFCFYLTRPKLQQALSIMKWFICIYLLVSLVYRISTFFDLILLHSPLTMLPLDPSSSGVSSGRT